MAQNFSNYELSKVFDSFDGKHFNVRFNKAGNIQLDVVHPELVGFFAGGYMQNYPERCKASYVFYKNDEGKILIRSIKRFGYNNSIYPLNMNYKSRHTDTWVANAMASVFNPFVYNIKYSYLDNLDMAIEFFANYLNKYHPELV